MSLSKQIEHLGIRGEGDLSSTESIVATTADASSKACLTISRVDMRDGVTGGVAQAMSCRNE